MKYCDNKYALIGTENSNGDTGFIYIDRGCHDYSWSSEPCAYRTPIPNNNVFDCSLSACKSKRKEVTEIAPNKFSNVKVIMIETAYDFINMTVKTKWFEVMDNDELAELGVMMCE